MMRALLPAASLVLVAALEVAAWRADWATDTSRHAQLKALRVASGQQLSLEQSDKQPDQAIVDYQMPAKHSHRVRIYMKRARLGDQTRGAFAEVHLPAPSGDGILDFGPDPDYEHIAGPECQVHLVVAFATPGASRSHTVLLYPPQPGEAGDPNAVRIIHLQSSLELVVRYSANSADGQHGPRCRGSLAMTQDTEHFSSPLGMDLEWTFVAAPDSDIRVTFAPDLWTGEGEFQFGQELESLTLEKTQPLRLAILPVGQSRIMASLERKGEPVLTANSLKLG